MPGLFDDLIAEAKAKKASNGNAGNPPAKTQDVFSWAMSKAAETVKASNPAAGMFDDLVAEEKAKKAPSTKPVVASPKDQDVFSWAASNASAAVNATKSANPAAGMFDDLVAEARAKKVGPVKVESPDDVLKKYSVGTPDNAPNLLETPLQKALGKKPLLSNDEVAYRKKAEARRIEERRQSLSPENIDRIARMAIARPGSFKLKRSDDPEMFDAVRQRIQLIQSNPNYDMDKETLIDAGKTESLAGSVNPPRPLDKVRQDAYDRAIAGLLNPISTNTPMTEASRIAAKAKVKNAEELTALALSLAMQAKNLTPMGAAAEIGLYGLGKMFAPDMVTPDNLLLGGAMGAAMPYAGKALGKGISKISESNAVRRMFGNDLLPEGFGPTLTKPVDVGYVPNATFGNLDEVPPQVVTPPVNPKPKAKGKPVKAPADPIPGSSVVDPVPAPNVVEPIPAPDVVEPVPTPKPKAKGKSAKIPVEPVPTPKPAEPIASPKITEPTPAPKGTVDSIATDDLLSFANGPMDDLLKRHNIDIPPRLTRESAEELAKEAVSGGHVDRAMKIAEDIIATGRGASPVETAALGIASQRAENKLKSLIELFDQTTDPTARLQVLDQIDELKADMLTLNRAAKTSGLDWSATGVARQAAFNEDDSFGGLIRRAIKANGGHDLTIEQARTIKAMSDEIEKLKGELTLAQSNQAKKAVSEDVRARTASGVTATKIERARAARIEALNEIAEIRKELMGSAFSNPIEPMARLVYASGKYVWHLASEKVWTSVDELLAKAKADIKEASGVELTDEQLLKGYREYQVSSGATKASLQSDLARLRSELTRMAKAATNEDAPKRIEELKRQIAEAEAALKEGRFADALPKKKVQRARSNEEILLRRRLDAARREAQAYIASNEAQTIWQKVNKHLSSMALLNPAARIQDFAANSVKLASELATGGLDWLISRGANALAGGSGKGITEMSFAKVRRILDGFGEALKDDFRRTMKYGDMDAMAKYGPSGIGGRLAGVTDIPFKEFYSRSMMDDLATQQARIELAAKGRSFSSADVASLAEKYIANPTPEMYLAAEEYALRQTFNNQNMVSRTIGSLIAQIPDGPTKVAVQQLLRFNKVISNVAMERAQYAGGEATVVYGLLKLLGARFSSKKITPMELRTVTQLIRRGFIGAGMRRLGELAYDKGLITPKFKQSGSTVYLDQDALGQLGGVMSPLLFGAASKAADNLQLTATQKESLKRRLLVDQAFSFPLVTDVKNSIYALNSDRSLSKFVGQAAGRILVPSVVRNLARSGDQEDGKFSVGQFLMDSGEPRDVTANDFVSQLLKQLPYFRNQLPTADRKVVPYGPEKKDRLPRRLKRPSISTLKKNL
jgi:hypothetical protein